MLLTIPQLLDGIREQVTVVSLAYLKQHFDVHNDALIDVREPGEVKQPTLVVV